MIDDDNPYAAPKAEVLIKDRHLDSSSDVWRDGKMLVVRKGAELPDRCLKCAAPTKGFRNRFSRSLSWHKPIWFLTFLISPILYVLVYFCVRRRAWVTVGFCPLHRKKRARAIALGWLVAIAGLGSIMAVGTASDMGLVSNSLQPIAMIAGVVLFLGGIIGGVTGSQVLVPRRIDKHFVWLSKVSPDYLATLPDWNA